MNKLKKSLSVLLTLVMLFTTFCFFPLDLGAVKADAAVNGIKIVVPETLYLTPSTGASTSIQYYINNNADGSVKTSQDTSAQVHITYPGAKLTSISAKTSADITLPSSITGLVGTTFGSSATTATGTFALPAGLNAGGTALVEWTFVFDVNGKTQTHYAYSVAYAPWYQPVGAAARAVGAHHNVYSSSILWVSGVHGYADGDSDSRHYVQTANFLPLITGVTAPNNNDPTTTWIQSDSNGLSATVSYYSISESGTKYHARANSISPTANLTVDTSRYNNFNQIPNFTVGFMVTDRENANEGSWYVSDYGTSTGSSYYNGTDRSGSRYDSDYNDSGTQFLSNSSDASSGIKYNGTWDKTISGTANFRIKSGVYGYHGGVIKSTSWNNNFVNISVTGANKGTLRTNVLNGTSYAKENYTADTWNVYYNKLREAANKLCTPTNSDVDTTEITNAEAGLHTNLTLNANGGALGANVPSPVALNIGGGTSVSFNNADVKAAFYATRTGYTFLGWSTDKDATEPPATVTVGFNDTVYAIWEANKYTVTFDNLIDYPAWNKAAGNGTVSDITDNGFTITSNDGAGESTCESPYFPVTPGKQYKIQMDITGTAWDVYIFFCDENGAWVDFQDGASNRYSTGGSTGVDPDNAIFTAPDKAEVVKAKIRVDANGSNNTVRFENIRVYEVGKVPEGVSYVNTTKVTYDSTYGTLPTPTRTGYEFQGWVDENGTPYASTTKVQITDTLRLYSTWEIGTYTITFDTKGGTAIAPISGHYNTAVTKPADPTKTGYIFTGWDKTIPDTIPAEDITITAGWSENSYAVFFDGNGFTGGTANAQINTTYTGDVEIPECTYEKTGYTFTYWTTNKDGTGTKYYPGDVVNKLTAVRDGGVTLYAQWSINSYNITYVYDNNTGETKVIPYDINDTVTALADPEKVGYTFAGWKVTTSEGNWVLGTVVDEGVTASGMYGNVTLTAQWTVNQYTITFDTDGAGEIDPITQDFGTPVNAPAAPTKEGYTFAGWDNLPETMPAGNTTVTALWTENDYTVTYNANGGEGSVDAQSFKYTDSVTLRDNAFTKTGYHFIGWAESADGAVKYEGGEAVDAALTAENGAEITLYAVWEKNTYTVTFDKNDAQATGEMAVQSFTYDEAENLDALGFSKEGYTFTGWNTSADGNGIAYTDKASVENLTAVNGGNVTLYAQWKINRYTVTVKYYNTDGEEKTSVIEGVEHGTAFISLAIPSDKADLYYNHALTTPDVNTVHYNFREWQDADGNDLNATTVITGNATFTADYSAEAHDYFVDGENTVNPGCTTTGVEAKYCHICNFRYQIEIPADGHGWVETGRTVDCTQGITVEYICSVANCGATKKEVLDAPGHVFTETTPKKEADCVNSGYEAYKTCTVCNLYFAPDADTMAAGAKDKTIIAAGGHNYGTWIAQIDATCEDEGILGHYTCSACNVNFDASYKVLDSLVIPANGHAYGELIPEVPATCVKEGVKAHYDCANCDKNFDENKNELTSLVIEIDPDNHDIKTVEAKAPTCTEDGYFAYEYCQRDGCTYTTYQVDPMKGHSYGTLIPEVAATCIKEGVKAHYTCSVCYVDFDENKEVLDSLVIEKNDNHDLATVEAKAPTCEDIGWNEYHYCKREGCNYTDYAENELGATDHDYRAVITTPATCTTKGVMTYTCQNDGSHVYSEDIPAAGHNFKDTIAYLAPTCEDAGHAAYKECSVCSKFFAENEGEYSLNGADSADAFTLEATDHNYKAVVTPPTCNDKGFTTYTCQNDSAHSYVDNYVDALGHTAGTPVVENDIPASCLVDGSYEEVVYCTVCGEELSREPKVHTAPGHKEEIRQENIQNATCTIPGSYDNVPYCAVCGEKLGEGSTVTGVTLPHNFSQKIVDEAHKKTDATCYSLAVYYYDCADCDAVATSDEDTFTAGEYASHTAGTAVVEDKVDATCYSEGSYNEVVYCSVCAEAGITEKLSSTPKTIEKIAHTPAAAVQEDIVPATCYSEGSYNEVVYCSVCKAEGIDEKLSSTPKTIEKIAHTSGAAVQEDIVPATCYSEGSYNEVVYCSVCEAQGIVEELTSTPKTIAKIAHTRGEAVRENIVDSTCHTEGSYDEVVYCSVCVAANVDAPYEFSRVKKAIAVKEHTPGEAVEENIVDSTCYSEGTYDEVVYCSVCAAADKKTELGRTEKTIAKKEHTEGDAETENFVDSSCYAEGSYNEVVYCSVCKAAGYTTVLSTETKTVDKKAHTAGETVIENTVAPTCYSKGSYDEVTYCTVCEAAGQGKVQISRNTVITDEVAHTPAEAVKENIVAPKCEEDGSYDLVVYCSVCAEANKIYVISTTPVTVPMTGHVSGTYTDKINEDAGNCMTEASWTLVTYCNACDKELEREDQTGEKNPAVHTGNNTVTQENVVAGTCVSEKTWIEVTTCECGDEISREAKKGEKDADNHTGTPTKTVDYKAPTCKEEGYTGDTHYTCCGVLYAKGTAIPTVDHTEGEAVVENDVPASCTVNGSYDEVVYCTVCGEEVSRVGKVHTAPGHKGGEAVTENNVLPTCTEDGGYDSVVYCSVCGEELSRTHFVVKTEGHKAGEPVRENEIPATETVDGSYDKVVYCSVCGEELSREKVITKVERTITFIMKDKTVEVKAYNGDTVALPDVSDVKGADGFIYKFVKWDKSVAVVNGDATYTAIYTEPADWSNLDSLEETLNEILEDGVVEDSVLQANKEQIDTVLEMIENLNKERDTLDKTQQSRIEFVSGKVIDLIDVIYPDIGSELVIEGASVFYTGGVISLKAVKMPLGQVINDAEWVSSDENIVFCANGKLYAVGTGTVTLTATRGILKASKTINVISGGNTRGITFTSINNTHFIIEDYMAVYNSNIIYWSDDQDLRFRVRVYQSFMFDDYIVYINGVEVEPGEDGYYVVPAGSGDAMVTIAGAMVDIGDDGEGGQTVTKWSFWEWLINLFRKIGEFFRNLFA